MSRKNEPTLAFKRGDLAVQLNEHDCGSLMYKGGFLPYALIGDIENEKYRRLVLSEDMLPAEATERTNLISADEDWPLPDCVDSWHTSGLVGGMGFLHRSTRDRHTESAITGGKSCLRSKT